MVEVGFSRRGRGLRGEWEGESDQLYKHVKLSNNKKARYSIYKHGNIKFIDEKFHITFCVYHIYILT